MCASLVDIIDGIHLDHAHHDFDMAIRSHNESGDLLDLQCLAGLPLQDLSDYALRTELSERVATGWRRNLS